MNPILALRQSFTMLGTNSTASVLGSQWTNPSEVTTVLMIIGGDVVQKALAQTTGCWYTPVCFSFGWVPYSFTALISVLGDGRLLPEPDVGCKVINLDSGYSRDNRNWVIGRLLRDSETHVQRLKPPGNEAIRISIWEAVENPKKPTEHHYWSIHIWGLVFMTLQLGLAIVPLLLYRDWGILLITGVGTILSIIMGALPQWTAEKLPNRQHSKSVVALTVGNGSRDVMVVIGGGKSLHLEELSVSETPRSGRPWKKFNNPEPDGRNKTWPKPRQIRRTTSELMATKLRGGFPMGFLVTYSACVILSILWLALLISVSALESHTWFLLGVGFIGMFQNAVLAAAEIKPEHRNLPLRYVETIVGMRKVMDGLMDFHVHYQRGEHLVREFFPGKLLPPEKAWWKGDRDAYDDDREKEMNTRGPPRSRMLDSKSETPARKDRDLDESAGAIIKSSAALQADHYGDTMPTFQCQPDKPKEPRTPEVWSSTVADPRRSDPNFRRVLRDSHTPSIAFPRSNPAPSLRNVSNLAAGNVDQNIASTLSSRSLSVSSARSASPVSKPPARAQEIDRSGMVYQRTAVDDVPGLTPTTHRGKSVLADELPEAADWV